MLSLPALWPALSFLCQTDLALFVAIKATELESGSSKSWFLSTVADQGRKLGGRTVNIHRPMTPLTLIVVAIAISRVFEYVRAQSNADLNATVACAMAPRAAGLSAMALSMTKSWIVPM